MLEEELDPEIAALLSDSISPKPAAQKQTSPQIKPVPLTSLRLLPAAAAAHVDLTGTSFKKITEFYSQTPHAAFKDPDYYKKALGGEGESSKRFHSLLTKFLTCQDSKDRSVYRQQIVPAYWDFLRGIVQKISSSSLPAPKKYVLRYGLVLPSLLTEEQKGTISRIIDTNIQGEPVYYLDEWFREISAGHIGISATDEARPAKRSGDDRTYFMQLQSKAQGKFQAADSCLKQKENERNMLELELRSRADILCNHQTISGMEPHTAPYTESQKKTAAELNEKLRDALKIDRELTKLISEYQDDRDDIKSINNKIQNNDFSNNVSTGDLMTEMDTVRQMAKMTVGRQGNHFPVLTREYYHCTPRTVGTRENVIDILAWIESIDPGAFCRIHKNQTNRIVPFVILVPTYGDTGFCWEPFDRYNRITSRGRIAVPMYPKNLQTALLTAVADLRWQVAKEKASYYWMEEGLTGQYYQWYASKKLKGDLKDFFINDYLLWMTKESEGVQRLDKEVRGIFWRHIPFAQDIKDKLKTRSLAYQELYQRDINRSMSDGY